jgi:hypothetical protein
MRVNMVLFFARSGVVRRLATFRCVVILSVARDLLCESTADAFADGFLRYAQDDPSTLRCPLCFAARHYRGAVA